MPIRIKALLFRARVLVAALLCSPLSTLIADEVRPAYLELSAAEQGGYHVLWKQPVVENKRLPIDPAFPVDCELRESAPPEVTGSALIKRWFTECDLSAARIEITGLRTRSLTSWSGISPQR